MIKEQLLDRYGPLMTIPDIAEIFHTNKAAIYNKIYRQTFEVDIFKVNGKYMAETAKVADYILEQQKVIAR